MSDCADRRSGVTGSVIPSGTTRPRAALGEGWVKRVIRGLNPFDARVRRTSMPRPVNTFSSMLVQAGQRYEGDIAFNPERRQSEQHRPDRSLPDRA
jgi:hypothetical protein